MEILLIFSAYFSFINWFSLKTIFKIKDNIKNFIISIMLGIICSFISISQECYDGWESNSIGTQGACSYHGGVTEYLTLTGFYLLFIWFIFFLITLYKYFKQEKLNLNNNEKYSKIEINRRKIIADTAFYYTCAIGLIIFTTISIYRNYPISIILVIISLIVIGKSYYLTKKLDSIECKIKDDKKVAKDRKLEEIKNKFPLFFSKIDEYNEKIQKAEFGMIKFCELNLPNSYKNKGLFITKISSDYIFAKGLAQLTGYLILINCHYGEQKPV